MYEQGQHPIDRKLRLSKASLTPPNAAELPCYFALRPVRIAGWGNGFALRSAVLSACSMPARSGRPILAAARRLR